MELVFIVMDKPRNTLPAFKLVGTYCQIPCDFIPIPVGNKHNFMVLTLHTEYLTETNF